MTDKRIHDHPLGAGFAHKDTKYDECNVCNQQTPYEKKQHIGTRKWYIVGAGQLCKECWERIYGEKETKE